MVLHLAQLLRRPCLDLMSKVLFFPNLCELNEALFLDRRHDRQRTNFAQRVESCEAKKYQFECDLSALLILTSVHDAESVDIFQSPPQTLENVSNSKSLDKTPRFRVTPSTGPCPNTLERVRNPTLEAMRRRRSLTFNIPPFTNPKNVIAEAFSSAKNNTDRDKAESCLNLRNGAHPEKKFTPSPL